MRTSVEFQDFVAEVLDAEAQTRDADAANGGQLRLGQRPGLALEGHFLRVAPRGHGVEASDETLELFRRQERRRPATEIDEVQRPAGDRRQVGVELPFVRKHVEVIADLLRVLVGIHAEVAEVAPLPAERNVEVEPQRHARNRRRLERGASVDGNRRPCSTPRTVDTWQRNSCRLQSDRPGQTGCYRPR